MKPISWLPSCLIVTAVLLAAATRAEGSELLVSHVQAALDPQTAAVDVWYRLDTVDGTPVTVRLFLSMDSGASWPYLCRTVSGDVGAGVLPGESRHLVWDVASDMPGFSSATCRLRVTADDAANLDDFAFVAPGTFTMGSPAGEPGYSGETQHQVTLAHGIDMHSTEVTNAQYRDLAQWAYDHGYATVAGAGLRDNLDGSTQELLHLEGACEISFSGGVFTVDAGREAHPVLAVTWYGAAAWCDWLSLRQGLPRAYDHGTWRCNGGQPYTAGGYRLPTEAEWEYACRAGTLTPFNTGSCLAAGTEANYRGADPYPGCPAGPYAGWTAPAGSGTANAFGLHDMHGNLAEWCHDLYGPYGGTVTEPVGPDTGSGLVVRGGSWADIAQDCRSASRASGDPGDARDTIGFRPVRATDSGAPPSGAITIDPEPDSLGAPWRLSGPYGFDRSGAGDLTITNLLTGSYTLAWECVEGWDGPDPAGATQILVANGHLVFTGAYVDVPGDDWFVFGDDFGCGVTFVPFSGTDIYAITIDSVYAHNSAKSMKVTVPPQGSALGAYAGGCCPSVAPRDLTEFNALTFYARSSVNSTLDEVGFGNDNSGLSLYAAGRAGVPLSTGWNFVVVPIPSSRKLVAERGLFTIAEGFEMAYPGGHTLWFDEIRFANLPNVARVSASMPTVTRQYLVGSTATIEGTTTRFDIDGAPVVVHHMSNYFDFFSSNPDVAVVEGNLIRVIGAGQDTITAKLDMLKVTGRVIITGYMGPTAAAPAPTVPAGDVISLYSDTYDAWPVDSFNPHWGGSTTQDAIHTIDGNDNLMYTTLNYVGIDFLSHPIDATQMTHLHLDVYAPVGTMFRVKPVAFNAAGSVIGQPELTFNATTVPAFAAGAWSSLEIPMADFAFTVPVDRIGQIVLSTSDARLVLVDNIYWHR